MKKRELQDRVVKVMKYKFKQMSEQIRHTISKGKVQLRVQLNNCLPIKNIPQNQVLIQNRYIRIDHSSSGKSVKQNHIQLDEQIVQAQCVGQVIFTKSKDVPIGTLVFGVFGWQKYHIANPHQFLIISPQQDPVSLLSLLGSPGATAYMGLFEIGKIKQGQTIVVSDAASYTGLYAVQFAKIAGCQVCGLVFNQKQADLVKAKGANHTIVINPKHIQKLEKDIKSVLPKGIDVFFDNIGEQVLDAGLANNRDNSRFILAGYKSLQGIEQKRGQQYKLKNYPRLIIKKNQMQGFLFSDYQEKIPNVLQSIYKLMKEGKIKHDSIQHPIKSIAQIPKIWQLIKSLQMSERLIVKLPDDREDKQIAYKL